MYLKSLAATQLSGDFLGFRPSSSKWWDGSQVPSCYCMLLMQVSWLKLIKIKSLALKATKLCNLPLARKFCSPSLKLRSRDRAVGMVTGYELDHWGLRVLVPVGWRIFSMSSRPALGPTQPPIQWVWGALSPGVKRQGREADRSPPAS
jgi:hypothetical protein